MSTTEFAAADRLTGAIVRLVGLLFVWFFVAFLGIPWWVLGCVYGGDVCWRAWQFWRAS